jgi:cytochrome P450
MSGEIKANIVQALVMPELRTVLRQTPLYKMFLARQGTFARVARETIQTRTEHGGYTTAETADLMSAFVEAQKKHPDVVTDLVLNGYVTLPIYAGSNSVAVALTSVLYLLGKNPHVQEKLYKSLVESKLPMPPPWNQITKLTYLEAVIRECFRYHPATSLISRRLVPEGPGLKLADGRVLPPGTTVGVNGCVTHFHKPTYGEDVHTFRPERWLKYESEGEEEYAYRLKNMHKADLTFGHGEWVCIGSNIARCEIHKVVATLYSIFDVSFSLRIISNHSR